MSSLVLFFFYRNILVSMPNNLKYEWQSNFLSDFVMPLREFYETVHGERSSLSVFCSQGDWSSFISEVRLQFKLILLRIKSHKHSSVT